MKQRSHVVALAMVVGALSVVSPRAQAVAVDAVADPRSAGTHALDLTGTLTPGDLASIDAAAARASCCGELMVVVIPSVDGAVPRAYTTQLFNRFALDTRGRNHGILALFALTDRKAEIVHGDGLPSAIERTTDKIMQDVVVAKMKAGDPRGAIVGAADAIADRVLTNRPPGAMDRAMDYASDQPGIAYGGLGGVGVLGLVSGRLVWRYRRRRCQRCGDKMERLDEQADDAHLTKGERFEEHLGSVDHDVWRCVSCGSVHKIAWNAFFTRYSRCGACRVRSLTKTSRTIVAATTSSTGTGETTEDCKSCGYHNTYTYTIARVQESSSSSSSGGGGGGSSSGGGSSGSW